MVAISAVTVKYSQNYYKIANDTYDVLNSAYCYISNSTDNGKTYVAIDDHNELYGHVNPDYKEITSESYNELLTDDDESADMYLLAVRTLAERGYVQYEISNFSRPGFESRHNLKYWHCEEYIGIGPSAHSFFGGRRFEVPRNLSDFIQSEKQNEYINEYEPGTFFEKAMLALRLSEGLDLNRYPEEATLVLKRASLFDGTGLTEINNNINDIDPNNTGKNAKNKLKSLNN